MSAVVKREAAAVPAAVTPDASALMKVIERAAGDPQYDIAKLEKLLAMKERWEADEARKAFNVAFASFKAEAIEIVKNKGVTDGPLKGKRYAELFSVVNSVTPALSRHGLSASWKLTKDEKDWIEVTCTLRHVLGHSEAVSMSGPPDQGGAKNPIQARASTITYLERYTLKAACGLAEQGDDNDGNGGARLNESTLATFLSEIDNAPDDKALMKAFYEAWKAAEALNDFKSMRSFGERKDARKKALPRAEGLP
jgi:hypothetical protein